MSWEDDKRLEHIRFQYRINGCVGPTCWKTSNNKLSFAGTRSIKGDWTPPPEDNTYDIRAVTECKPTGLAEYDTDQSPPITGTIDRNAPKIVMLTSSSNAKTVGHHDKVSERAPCSAPSAYQLLANMDALHNIKL